jgi:predicted metal-dependent hydrolase
MSAMTPEAGGILGEVREFLSSLTLELPLVFRNLPGKVLKPSRHVPYRGQNLPLRLLEAPNAARSEIVHDESGLTLVRGQDRQKPQAVLREWLVDRAREAFVERAAHWAPLLGVRYARITIRDQRTVWGSCTRAGHLNFNWRIVMAPPQTLDYLVIHELAHLREMNHSKRFWVIVAAHCPDWRSHRDWLRDHSRRLKAAVRRG